MRSDRRDPEKQRINSRRQHFRRKEKVYTYSIRIPNELADILLAQAKFQGVSFNEIVNKLIREYLTT